MAHFSGDSSGAGRKSLPGSLYQNRDKTSGLYAHDVVIVGSDDGEVPAHKIILGTESTYFENAINLELSSTLPIRLEEREYTTEILETLIKYIYLPESEIDLVDITQMSKLLEAADKFGIPEFKKKYLKKLNRNVASSITESNWSLFFTEGVKLNESESFFKPIYSFMKGFDFIASEEFLNLTTDEFRIMLKSSNRPFDKDSVMKATLKWVGRNGSEYSDEFVELWGTFDKPSSSAAKKSARSNSTSSKGESLSGRSTRDSAKNKREMPSSSTSTTTRGRGGRGRGTGTVYRGRAGKSAPATGPVQPESGEDQSSDEESDNENGNKNKKIKLERNADLPMPADQAQEIESDSSDLEIIEEIQNQSTKSLLFFGKFKKSNCLLSYNLENKETLQAAAMPTANLKDMNLIAVEDRIYCLGGTIREKRQDSVKSFSIEELCDVNHLNKAWDNEETSLFSGRCLFPSLLFNNTIFMFGGCDGTSVSNAIEKWDITNKNKGWVDHVFHMEYTRERFGVVMHDNTVYLVGGKGTPTFKPGELVPLSSAESFGFKKNKIERLPSLNEPRVDVRVVILKDKIFAIGGIVNLKKNKKVSSVEILDTTNISRGWKRAKSSLKAPRANGWAFVLDEKIYYVGGNDGRKPTMEIYSPKLDSWRIADSDLPEGSDFSTSVLLL